MRKIAVIDAETDPFKHGRIPKPFIWGFYDGAIYREFIQTDDLVDFLADQELIVYAHNGGKFDYHFMLEHLMPYDDLKIINGRLAKFKIGVCEFRDSFNIIPVPLADYQKEEIDYAIFEEDKRYLSENWKRITEYLNSDCVYLYDLVSGFISEYGCHLTQATASMKTWQKMTKRKPPVSNSDYYDAFKQFYYGGRVECFEKGVIDRECQSIDIKSAYPFAMLSEHPFGVEFDIIQNEDIKRGYYDGIVGNYFYTVRCCSFGAFPYRALDGSLVFPKDGMVRTFAITGWELLAAKRTKTINPDFEILEIRHHFDYFDFSEYINYFYERRKVAEASGDIADKLFCKLLMNSLYGKFGANPDNYSSFILLPADSVPDLYDAVPDTLIEDIDGSLITLPGKQMIKRGQVLDNNLDSDFVFSGMLGPWVLGAQDLDEEAKRYYNVATSASITGYVRAYLWEAICSAKGVIYCDTDSITAKSFGSNIVYGKELGQWEIEGIYDRGAVGGKKLYAFHHKEKQKKGKQWKIASKGVKFDQDEIYRICAGETVIYEPENPSFSIHSKPKFIDRKIKMR